MKINSINNSTNFGLRKDSVVDLIFDAARQQAKKQARKNPELIDYTERLIKRIERRAPKATLVTTGGDFRLNKLGTQYYMNDIIPGKRLIPSLENLDYMLAEFDKNYIVKNMHEKMGFPNGKDYALDAADHFIKRKNGETIALYTQSPTYLAEETGVQTTTSRLLKEFNDALSKKNK